MQSQELGVHLHGNSATEEYRAAQLLKDLIDRNLDPSLRACVSMYSPLHVFGQPVEELDLLLHAYFPEGVVRKVRLAEHQQEQAIELQDLIVVIEVKGHSRDKVGVGTAGIEVLYRTGWENAARQSHLQAISVSGFIQEHIGWKPWVCNLIFFPHLQERDLPTGGHRYLAADSTFENFLERLCVSKKIRDRRGGDTPIPFCCTNQFDSKQRQKRNEQLQQLLRIERPAIPTVAPTPAFAGRQPLRALRYWPAILALTVLFLLFATAFTLIEKIGRGVAQNHVPVDTVVNSEPRLNTCARVTASCGCAMITRVRQGQKVWIQWMADQPPAEQFLRDPEGRSLSFQFAESRNSARNAARHCYLAQLRLPRTMSTGFYSVQATTAMAPGRPASVVSRGIDVVQ